MGTVHLGRRAGAGGFTRVVAIKRLYPRLIHDVAFRRALLTEARIAARLHHPNVVGVEDLEELGGELLLVMDYVEGASLAELLVEPPSVLPRDVSVRIVLDAAAGLRAAHQLRDDDGRPLGVVHRDVSPANLLVGADGTTRVTDFGLARCTSALTDEPTQAGVFKGKCAYMAPEYLCGSGIDARADVFALGVILWELLAGRRLFKTRQPLETMSNVLTMRAPGLSAVAPECGTTFDALLATALSKTPEERFPDAASFRAALGDAARRGGGIASSSDVAAIVQVLAGDAVAVRRALLGAGAPPEPSDTRLRVAPATDEATATTRVETDPHAWRSAIELR